MKLLLVGMPASGKSTYLGALAHLLTSGRKETVLKLVSLTDSQAHAAMLEEQWLSCEPVARTKLRSSQEGLFRISLNDGRTQADLSIPDLSGEAFRMPAARDRAPKGFFDSLVDADGLMVFTNADRAPDDRLLFDASLQYDALGDAFDAELAQAALTDDGVAALAPTADATTDASETSNATPDETASTDQPALAPPPFDPDEMPEEVLLVELLQQLNRSPLDLKPRRLAIVASAWDVVDQNEPITPLEWFKRNRPTLSQFLEFNDHAWTVEIWGISALGGSLPENTQRLLELAEPTDRIQVVSGVETSHDLTAPIRWLMTETSVGTA